MTISYARDMGRPIGRPIILAAKFFFTVFTKRWFSGHREPPHFFISLAILLC